MNVESASQHNEHEKRGKVKRVWTKEEEEALLAILEDIVAHGGRADCGSFKPGTLKQMELQLDNILPNCGLKASPHILSKLKHWKKQYGIVYDMLNTSGFGWNDVRKCVEIDSEEAWQCYVQQHKSAEQWRGKPFPLYERLSIIFGKDRATGKAAETPDELATEHLDEVNFDEELERHENYSPMSANEMSVDQSAAQTEPRLSRRKRGRSSDPLVRTLEQFNVVFKEVMEKSNQDVAQYMDILARKKVKRDEAIASDLEVMELPFSDRIRLMTIFMDKPAIAEVFKSLRDENDKIKFIGELLSGGFHD